MNHDKPGDFRGYPGILLLRHSWGYSMRLSTCCNCPKQSSGVPVATFSRASTAAIDSAIHHLDSFGFIWLHLCTTFGNVSRRAGRFQCFNRLDVGFEALPLSIQDRLTNKRKQSSR